MRNVEEHRLHIVSVCRSFPTPTDLSSGIFVFNRVKAVARQADVRVLQPVPYFPVFRPMPGWAAASARVQESLEIEHAPMFYVPGAFKFLDADWLARSISSRVERIHRERSIDLLDAHFGYPDGVACVEVAHRLGIPAFVTIRGFEKEFASRPRIGPRMRRALNAATGVIAVSASLRDFAVGLGVPAEKICVIHNAIDNGLFKYGDRDEARRLLGLPVGQPLVVSVGHLIERKRHHRLIHAFERLLPHVPAAKLVIIGGRSSEPSHPAELRAIVDKLGLQDRVTFAGNLPPKEVVRWLEAADVFGLATAREGCCNAVLEALAVGVPVVTTAVGDNAVFVRPGKNGFLVPVDDVAGLAEMLLESLRRSDWDRQLIAENLRAQVGDWSDVAARVVEFFGLRLGR